MFPPANANPQKEPAAQVWGVKILNLHPSATSHPASHYPPAQIGHATNPGTHTGSKWTEDKKTSYSIPKRLLRLISLPGPTQLRIEKSERTREQEFPLLLPVTAAHTPAPVQGLRLLSCTSAPPGNIMFPKIAPAPSSRPCALSAAPIREVPMLKLLQIQSGVKMARITSTLLKKKEPSCKFALLLMLTYLPQMSPMAPPSASVTRLIALEEEVKASVGRKKSAPGQLHVPPTAAADTLPSCISSKRKSHVLYQVVHFIGLVRILLLTVRFCCVYRQKRREEKEGRPKTEVTFRPNESIIPATEVKLFCLNIYCDHYRN